MKPIQEQVLQCKVLEQQPLVERLRTRSAIRRSIKNRKSVQEGKPDRIADLLDESALALEDKDKLISKLERDMNDIKE